MIAPLVDTEATRLGDQDGRWSAARYTDQKEYVWTFWRPYSCCRGVGKFLYSVEF